MEGSMDVKLSIGEEDVGTNISIKVEVQKDEGGASLNNASATVQTAEQQVPAKVRAAARKLAGVIKGANVEDINSTIETLADQADASGIFNFRGQSWGSLLHIAAATGKSNILRPLLPHVDAHLIAAEDDWGNTPLHIATKAKALGVVVMLIRRARDLPEVENILWKKNNYGNTALHEAVLKDDADLVSYLSGEDLEPVYWENMDRKSPLYLALDIGDPKIFQHLISLSLDPSRIKGLPPVHGAFAREQYDLVDKILEGNMKLFAMTDSGEGNVFHLAAFLKKPQVLKFLRPETEYLAQARDANGDLPIHIASKSGHVALIEKLHPISHSVNGHRQTVLHLAAKYGRASTVKYILSHPDLGKMINERDHDGNTPAHLATKYLQPAALTHLVLDERIKPSLLNCDHLAAYDIAQNHSRRGLRQGLVRMLLLSVSAKRPDQFILKPEAREEEYTSGRMLNQEKLDDALDKWLLVATLVTTVTFAAGFAVPGGFNGSDMAPKDERGMATMLDNRKFQAFVICNTIAMFCSMGSVLGFLAAFMTEIHLSLFGFQLAGMLLAISLLAMSAAFLIGVALTVSKLSWLATVILGIGSAFVFIITGASLSPVVIPLSIRFTFLLDCLRPIRPLVSRFLLACIILLDVETTLDDSKEGKAESKTSASRPLDGGRKD